MSDATLTNATTVDEAPVLACAFCGKETKSKSGLTNHEKICAKNPALVKSTQPAPAPTPVASVSAPVPASTYTTARVPQINHRDRMPSDRTTERTGERTNGQKPQTNGQKSPFEIGAFFMMPDYIPVILDINFCIALGNHILEHGSTNKAILAFGHQCRKLDEE